MKAVCDWKGIQIKSGVDLRHGDLVLVVRDPIDRFISSFYHSKVSREVSMKTHINLILNQFKEFLTHYEKYGEGIEDPHIYSQLWQFQKYGIDIRENPNCKIYHLEDIHIGFNQLNKKWKGTDNIDWKGMAHNFFEGGEFNEQLPIFKDLGIDLEKWDKFHIIALYSFILVGLTQHHRNEARGFRDFLKSDHGDLYNRMIKLLYEENYTLGYKMDL
jgi:hypothetical protein